MKQIIWILLLTAVSVVAKSPTGSYAPGEVNCPSNNVTALRKGDKISDSEREWLEQRHKKTDLALIEYLSDANLEDFNPTKFIEGSNKSINIALAFSGGGYRSMFVSAGEFAALDSRSSEVSKSVGLSGILQSSSYIAGLSGGGWFVGSLTMQGFPTVDEVVFEDPNDVWNITKDRQLVNQHGLWTIAIPALFDNLKGLLSHMNNWNPTVKGPGIKEEVQFKDNAGFKTTVTDYWSRALAYQLSPAGDNNYGSDSTWSDIRDIDSFKNHDQPFPLVVAIGRRPDTIVYNLNSTIVEFNPFELGSFDTSLNSFTDIKYIGTNVTNGVPVYEDSCVRGFDNAGFVLGTSSSLFNEFLNTLVCDDCNSLNPIVKFFVKRILTSMSKKYIDVAAYNPNPFYQSEYATSKNTINNDTLYLMDGGLAGEQMPLSSLMTTQRALDVVFAFDNSPGWPDGSLLIATYERQFSVQGASQICPHVPDTETFLSQNLTAKPTFFGCYADNMTDLVKDGVVPPLVIYMANRPYQFWSNTSTFKLEYEDPEKKGMIKNGFDIVSRLNNTADNEWQACVACALIRREEERRDIEQTSQCKKCFAKYCWDGQTANVASDYTAPVNFTLNGLTNDPMLLWNNDTSVVVVKRDSSGASTVIPSLFTVLSLVFLYICTI